MKDSILSTIDNVRCTITGTILNVKIYWAAWKMVLTAPFHKNDE